MSYRPNIPNDDSPPYYIGLQGCSGGGCDGPICVAGNESISGSASMEAGATQALSVADLDPNQPCGELNYFWYCTAGTLANGSAVAEGGEEWGGLSVDFIAPDDGTTSVTITLRVKHAEGNPDWQGAFCAELEITIGLVPTCDCNDNEEYITDRDILVYGSEYLKPPYNYSLEYWGGVARLQVLNRADDSGETPCTTEYSWEIKQEGYHHALDFGSCPDSQLAQISIDCPTTTPIVGSRLEVCVQPPASGELSICPEDYFRFISRLIYPGYFDGDPLQKSAQGFGPFWYHIPPMWVSGADYIVGDQICVSLSYFYVCIQANSGVTDAPSTRPDLWYRLTQTGIQLGLYMLHPDWPDQFFTLGSLIDVITISPQLGAATDYTNSSCSSHSYQTTTPDSPVSSPGWLGYLYLSSNNGVTTDVTINKQVGVGMGAAYLQMATIQGFCKSNPVPHSEHPIALIPCNCGTSGVTNKIEITADGQDYYPDHNDPDNPVYIDQDIFITASVYAGGSVSSPCTDANIANLAFKWQLAAMEPGNTSYIVGADGNGIYIGSSCQIYISDWNGLFAIVLHCLDYDNIPEASPDAAFVAYIYVEDTSNCNCSGTEVITANPSSSYVEAGGQVSLGISGRSSINPCVSAYTWNVVSAPGEDPMLDYIDPPQGLSATLYVEDGEYSPPELLIELKCRGSRVATRSWTVIDCFCTCDPDIYGPATMEPQDTVTLTLTGRASLYGCPYTYFLWEISDEPISGQCQLDSPFGYSNQLTSGAAPGTVTVTVYCHGAPVATIDIQISGCFCDVGETLTATSTTIIRDGETSDLDIEDRHPLYPCGGQEYSWNLAPSSPGDCQLSNSTGLTNTLTSGHITGVARVRVSCKASANFLYKDIAIVGCVCGYGSIGVDSGCQGGASTDCELYVGGTMNMYPPSTPDPSRPCYDDDYTWTAVIGSSRCTLTPYYDGHCHYRATSAGAVEIELECLGTVIDSLTILNTTACCGSENISGPFTIASGSSASYTLSSADCTADRYEWEILGANPDTGSSFASSGDPVQFKENVKSVTIYSPSTGGSEEIELVVYCNGNEMDSVIILSGCTGSSGVTIFGDAVVTPYGSHQFALVGSGGLCPSEYYDWTYSGTGSIVDPTGVTVATVATGGPRKNNVISCRFNDGSIFDSHTFDCLYEYDPHVEVLSLMCPTIKLTAQVRNQSGTLMYGLSKSNWTITRNPFTSPSVRSIVRYRAPNPNYRVFCSIIMDVSGSMSSTDKARMRDGAIAWVNAMASNDYAEVVFFATSWRLEQVATNSKSALISAITNGPTGGDIGIGTRLYRTMYNRIDDGVDDMHMAHGGTSGDYCMELVLTDGYDSEGGYTPSQIITEATTGVSPPCHIHIIGLGNDCAKSILANISEDTDGTFLYAPNNSAIIEAYNDIVGIIRTKYLIEFNAPSSSDSATIQVKVDDGNGTGYDLIEYNCVTYTWDYIYEGYPPIGSAGHCSNDGRAIDGNANTYAQGTFPDMGNYQEITFNFTGHPGRTPTQAKVIIRYASMIPVYVGDPNRMGIRIGSSSWLTLPDTSWTGWGNACSPEVITERTYTFTSGLSWTMKLRIQNIAGDSVGGCFRIYEVRPVVVAVA